ncbi:MAG TPA: radical SAM protein, partial [Pirellulales bacterium]|nr:radical SAM protein [Pirellulales bacterium]
IDPLFPVNSTHHRSRGLVCRTGESVVSVDGDGNVRRCHFVPTVIGNLYDPEFAPRLQPRLCPNETCGCHIGYVHMPHLALAEVFGEGILERIPWERPLFPILAPDS